MRGSDVSLTPCVDLDLHLTDGTGCVCIYYTRMHVPNASTLWSIVFNGQPALMADM